MPSSRSVIDENGNLFGVVNVIDALVVFLILAVVVAGVSLVLSGGDESETTELGTTYVTLDIGDLPEYILAEMSEGDSYSPGGSSQLTITDLHAASAGNQSHAFVRAELRGPVDGESIRYAEDIPQLGRALTISTNQYNTTGTIIAIGENDSLARETTAVLLRDTVGADTAESITEGDSMTVAGDSVAQVETVTTYATVNPDRRQVFVGVSLETLSATTPQFGGTTLQDGQQLTFQTANYSLYGTTQRVGATEQRGTETTRTVTLQLTNVSEQRADTFEPGMAEQSGGETVANITGVSVEPTTVVTTADNGSVRAVDHPYLREVTLTTELSVRETASGVRFKGDTIEQGSTVVIDFGPVTVQAEVVSLEA
jgi:hypothetical protein